MLRGEFIGFIEKLETTPGPHNRHIDLFKQIKEEARNTGSYNHSQAFKEIRTLSNGEEDESLFPLKCILLAFLHLQKSAFDKSLEEAKKTIRFINKEEKELTAHSDYYTLLLSTAYILHTFASMLKNNEEEHKLAKETLQDITSAIALTPDNEIAYLVRAILYYYYKKNKTAEAIEDLNEAIKINSHYESAYLLLSYIYLSNKHTGYDLSKTINYALEALEKTNNVFSAISYALLSMAYAQLGKFDECYNAATNALTGMQHTPKDTHPDPDMVHAIKGYAALGKAVIELENYPSILQTPSKKQESTKIKAITPAQKQLLQDKLEALTRINTSLKPALSELLKNPTKENKNAVIEILHSENATLGKDRGYSKIAKNIALAIALIGVGYVAAGLINLAITRGKHFAFFTPKSMQKVEAVERHAMDYYKKNKPK